MKDVKVHAKDILRMIPDEELAKLSSSTKVDYCAKVLSGERMFYLSSGRLQISRHNSFVATYPAHGTKILILSAVLLFLNCRLADDMS